MTGIARITEWDRQANQKVKDGVSLAVDFDPKTLSVTYNPMGPVRSAYLRTPPGTRSKAPTEQTGETDTFTVDLLFDSSVEGTSVQLKTDQLVRLISYDKPTDNPPPRKVVQFHWGSFTFYGSITALSQTFTFFDASGTPLRADVHLVMTGVSLLDTDDKRAASSGGGLGGGVGASASVGASFGAGAGLGASAGVSASASVGSTAAVGTTPLSLSQSGDTVAAVAARAGGGVSWKAVAAANGIDNPRLLVPGTVIDASIRTS